jgi:hypothetical protein
MTAADVTTEPTASDTTQAHTTHPTGWLLGQIAIDRSFLLKIVNTSPLVEKTNRIVLNTLLVRADPKVETDGINYIYSYSTTIRYQDLEYDTKLSPATVKNAVVDLERLGLLSRITRGCRPNTFVINAIAIVEKGWGR